MRKYEKSIPKGGFYGQISKFLEPIAGLEPATYALRMRYSTN